MDQSTHEDGQRGLLRRSLDAFLNPVLPEERQAAARARERLPGALRGPELADQVLGVASGGCAATYGVHEGCNFACTACYLAGEANGTPPLPFEEVREQLDRIRLELGPAGNVQITAGEVTLLPVEELIRIVRHCVQIGLSPMLMTNGQIILQDPGYLERLVVEAGLEKIAIHIDTTQRGRAGMRVPRSERELNPVREAFRELILETRRRTGRALHAAHTVTVDDDNLAEVADLVRWVLEQGSAFRMISFQPVADIGRTVSSAAADARQQVWRQICAGLGVTADPHTFYLGDPRCSSIHMSIVVNTARGADVVEVVRQDRRLDRWFFRRLLHGGLGGFSPDGEPRLLNLARLLGRLVRHPRYLVDIPFYSTYRLFTEWRTVARLLRDVVLLRRWSVRPFIVVVHHFMDEELLATDEGRQRMAACAFRAPIDGQMISMCALNGSGLRRRKNLDDRARLGRVPDPSPLAHAASATSRETDR